ncbi:hypothetical protein GMLC_05370 [Geomonas limicola]|uniref:Uncharacterized protein n=1 Tax=Geomonas limicola TaxID=2740186 RepID=A0A6V8N343_9BACT|nr:hypothetical protein [Geomonas limicola]GFO66958.1 hypothetical protein GMLC_05370 [Geomonas limicola]
MKAVWEKVFEYASMPVHGSLSRKLRKGIKVQVNEGKVYAEATLFLGDEFLRISEEEGQKEAINTYYDWNMVSSVRTLCDKEESPRKPK